uniref:Mannose receptor, C type 1b n=1 Tax=Sparus aurata TaxID=8175 RepID=A0A671TXN4_SPAAU
MLPISNNVVLNAALQKNLCMCRNIILYNIFSTDLFLVHPSADSPFSLTNKATGFCLVKRSTRCVDVRWTTGDRLLVPTTKKCLGVQGKTVNSEVTQYDCDDKSELQKWECRNETLLALKTTQHPCRMIHLQQLRLRRPIVIKLFFFSLSELYTLGGNAFGKICMFPFLYKDRWYGDCTQSDSSTRRFWCAVETKFEHEQWGYCPSNSNEHWSKNLVTGAYYQLNTQSVLTWDQAAASCKQQGASLLSVSDPNEQAYLSALLETGKHKLWIGLMLDPEHGWQWSDAKPFRYLRWTSGHPLPNPGHNCAFLDSAGQHTWQSSSCAKKLGYICYKDGAPPTHPQSFCSSPWIPYNGHCFQLQRTLQTWSNAQKECRKEGGDLVSVRNVEDHSFVISQLGYASTDELWIGLNDIRTEGLFDWSDHSPVTFTSWEFGKPSVSTGAEDCVIIAGEKGNWGDRSCDEQHGFICMKQSSTDSTGDEVQMDLGCKIGWKKHGSYCYFVGTETKTFDEAKDDCEASGSYLADVSNGVDNAFLVSLVGLRPEKYFWLGLSNQKNIDEFMWTKGNSVRFTHWNTGMPGYSQGCVAMTTGVLAGLWDLLPCTNRSKYICKHLAEGALPTVPVPTQSPPKCAEGWNRVGTRNYCAKVQPEFRPRSSEKTWFEARDYCRAIGGDLLSIHSAHQTVLAWIGLRAPDTSTGYTWSDGSPLNFQHWQEGEPNNHNNDESCAEFRIYNWDESGSWNDVNCESYNDWLCQIRAGVTPRPPPNNTAVETETTSDGWLVWGGNHYFIVRNSMYMDDARQFCQQRHGDLVSISTKEENVFLWKQVGILIWQVLKNVGIQRWDENQPSTDNFNSKCVMMNYYMVKTHNCIYFPQCYSIVTNRAMTWEDARRQCISIGGNLVSIPTRRVQGLLDCLIIYMVLNIFYTYIILKTLTISNVLQQDDCVMMTSSPTIGAGKWLSKSCNDTYGYICNRNLDPNTQSPPDTVIPDIYVAVGNDSIKAVTKNLTWEDARKECENDKANLASLRNEWTQAYVELLAMNLKAPVWIGLNKEKTGGYFRYVDGWHMTFASWAEGEPSRGKPCVYMDTDGKWWTAFCNQTLNSVCMQTTDVPPTESTSFPGVCPEETKEEYRPSYSWTPFKGHCYLFVTDEIEWADAASSCARHGGMLASIEDPDEQKFIENRVEIFQDSISDFWIGLYKTHKGTWQWLDKTVLDYTNWALDEPENDYGEISTADGTWKSGRRWHDRGYICKTAKGKVIISIDSRNRAHTTLIVVLIITAVAGLMAATFFFYKKSAQPLPTFDNPLYFDSERSQPDVVDTNKLIENAEVENPEPIITL